MFTDKDLADDNLFSGVLVKSLSFYCCSAFNPYFNYYYFILIMGKGELWAKVRFNNYLQYSYFTSRARLLLLSQLTSPNCQTSQRPTPGQAPPNQSTYWYITPIRLGLAEFSCARRSECLRLSMVKKLTELEYRCRVNYCISAALCLNRDLRLHQQSAYNIDQCVQAEVRVTPAPG